jgi:hypothetical protein
MTSSQASGGLSVAANRNRGRRHASALARLEMLIVVRSSLGEPGQEDWISW